MAGHALFRVAVAVSVLSAAAAGAAPLALVVRADGQDAAVEWKARPGCTVRFKAPVVTLADGGRTAKVALVSHQMDNGRAALHYSIAVAGRGPARQGKCDVVYTVSAAKGRATLRQETDLRFDEPLRSDITMTHTIEVVGRPISHLTLPLRNGVVKTVALAGRQGGAAYYLLGRGATGRAGDELALPVVELGKGNALAVATDPYCGAQFRVEGASVPVATTW